MRMLKLMLSRTGLLAASLLLLCGQALAETAGRVSFVTGEVTASAASGGSRALRRGDAINSGDRINTRGGRLQIRFTDGGFVSLQPNSVFAVDEYLYNNRKPEETSLFFSLLQGGMRTVTGAIGKVNKQSYKVRTPVATIGIRGTEYLASLDDSGLVVSVGSGFVHVENTAGNITGGARQNISVRDLRTAPALTEEKANIRATDVQGDQQRRRERREERRELAGDGGLLERHFDGTVRVGDVQDERGDYVFLFRTALFASGPGFTAAYAAPMGVGTAGGYNRTAVGGTDDSLHVLFDDAGSMQAATWLGATSFARGFGTDEGNNSVGYLKWGAWSQSLLPVDGTTVIAGGSTNSLFNNDYMHYIVGRMTPLDVFTTITPGSSAVYSLQGGSIATGTDGSFGRLGANSQMTVYFSASPSINADLHVLMNSGNNYLLSGYASVAAALGTATFSMSSADFTVSCTTSVTGPCSGDVSGFFAGPHAEQIGLSYQVTDSSNASRTVSGTGAFGRGDILPPSTGISAGQ